MQGGLLGLFWIIFLSMLPISELRGGIPLAYFVYDYPMWQALVICVIANLVPIPIILIFFRYVEKWLRRFDTFNRFFNWLFERTRNKVRDKVKKYGAPGLIIFVAIPLPVTGGWTGALAAYLLDMEFKRSLAAIAAGVLIAGLIVSAVCLWAPGLLAIFGANV